MDGPRAETDSWTVGQVARLSGLTTRTLRHYDRIGLLRPRVADNGYRRYGEPELQRLQHVLVLREVGLPLERIGAVLDGALDRHDALREHLALLRGERDRLARAVASVERTLEHWQEGTTMDVGEMFAGFAAKGPALEERLAADHGDGVRATFATSRARSAAMTAEEKADVVEQWRVVEDRLFDLFRDGHRALPDRPLDPALEAALAAHHAQVSRFWAPDRASYTGLGELYVADPEFRARYDARDPHFAGFLRDGVAAWAAAHLS
ncbi:MAG: MerR family transcriptional regulator [Kineosporiaceae bacterium]